MRKNKSSNASIFLGVTDAEGTTYYQMFQVDSHLWRGILALSDVQSWKGLDGRIHRRDRCGIVNQAIADYLALHVASHAQVQEFRRRSRLRTAIEAFKSAILEPRFNIKPHIN